MGGWCRVPWSARAKDFIQPENVKPRKDYLWRRLTTKICCKENRRFWNWLHYRQSSVLAMKWFSEDRFHCIKIENLINLNWNFFRWTNKTCWRIFSNLDEPPKSWRKILFLVFFYRDLRFIGLYISDSVIYGTLLFLLKYLLQYDIELCIPDGDWFSIFPSPGTELSSPLIHLCSYLIPIYIY